MARRKRIVMTPTKTTYKFLEQCTNYYAQPKLNGIRMQYDPSTHQLYSSTGLPITTLPHILHACNKLNLTYKLDGEAYTHNMRFEDICSIVKRTSLHPDYESIQYHIYDILIPNTPFTSRLLHLDNMQSKLDPAGPIRIVETLYLTAPAVALPTLTNYVAAGYEGIILRHPGNIYIPTKSKTILKYKPRKTGTALIVGYNEEIDIHGNPKHRLGSFIALFNKATFAVGSGLTDSERMHYWDIRDALVNNALVKFKYQELSKYNVPVNPVFVDLIRGD